MTKEELRKWLKNLKSDIGNSQHHELWHYEQAIDIVIEALSDKDINVPSNDCISRKAAIDVVEKYFTNILKLNPDICIDGLRSLPPAETIIRCKDCIYYSNGECDSNEMWQNLCGETTEVDYISRYPNDFCSYEERKNYEEKRNDDGR